MRINIKVIANNKQVKALNVKLAKDHVDYFVPLYMDEFAGLKGLALDIHVNGDYSKEGLNPLIGENIDELGTRFPDMSEVYAPELQEKVRKAAEKLQIPLQEGVYMQFTGPSYETPAEIRMCRTWGGDAAGMSTACEAVAANHMGMKVCGISCITNLAAGMSKQKLNHKEVQETADRVSRQFKQLVTEVIRTI